MSKKVEIKSCIDCPHMDYVYYDYDGECLKMRRVIKDEININEEIHPECPLEDYNE